MTTDKQRLENIEFMTLTIVDGLTDVVTGYELEDVDYEWLIEKAKKAIDLEILLEDHVQLEQKQAQEIARLQKSLASATKKVGDQNIKMQNLNTQIQTHKETEKHLKEYVKNIEVLKNVGSRSGS
ncbi:hypothetical protein ACM26V_00310 [Salipaludibacillus sp. HK11]|uniref:hypothetical protein n=1 Tax=Salipaludibacillus sp. HK11 TaxID=3394320 RepID=UPI0039FBF4FA